MNKERYQIIKKYRGRYQALDNGVDMLGKYVSQHEANQTIIAQKLQDKILQHTKILRIAESITTLTGESLYDVVYQFMIRKYSDEMRLYMQKPRQFKIDFEKHVEANRKAREESAEWHRLNFH